MLNAQGMMLIFISHVVIANMTEDIIKLSVG